jgi:hypothetical protein
MPARLGKSTLHADRRSMGISRRKHPVAAYVGFVVLLIAAGYLCFELGRYRGGYSLLDARRERERHERELASREATIEDLKRRITVLSTSREIDRETYSQVKRDLERLQARLQSQEEELAFYRGIVSPEDGSAGLRIQSLEVVPGDSERNYLMRLVLVQAITHRRRVKGTVELHVSGSLDGHPSALQLADMISGGASGELDYQFRYFQGLERQLTLPVGFEPERVEVQILPSEPKGDPVTQSFEWSAIAG